MGDGVDSGVSVALAIEYVDPARLDIDLDADEWPTLIADCARAMIACGADPLQTQLVITGDFVRSVQDRGDADPDLYAGFDTRRNTGTVMGKTIPRTADGKRVDILLHAAMFVPVSDEPEAVEDLAYRTLVHEAQHAVIAQAGEATHEFASEPWARRNLLNSADQVLEEYRAERATVELTWESGWDDATAIHETLETWQSDLSRIVTDEYQQHRDVSRLAYGVLQECHTVWKLLAYIVARSAESRDALVASASGHELWPLMVGLHWHEFVRRLNLVPDARVRTPRSVLDECADDLANLMQRWLRTLGFEFVDHDNGQSSFLVTDWDLLVRQRFSEG